MKYGEEELREAKRQIDSIDRKLTETIVTLQAKENADRLKSQMTLAKRRLEAMKIATDLIDEALAQLSNE